MIDLQPWSDDDLWVVERFLSDPNMTEHLGGPQSHGQILEAHRRFLNTGTSGAGQMLKVVLEPASGVIGNIGFWDKTWRDQLVYETGWMIFPEYQGRGFASKALAMLLGRLRGDHTRRFLHAFPSITNAPSNALCRKLAFANLGEVEFEYPPGNLLRCNDWRLDLTLDQDPPDPEGREVKK
jgi:RimJ/RimL family protein N-acetyltransferase